MIVKATVEIQKDGITIVLTNEEAQSLYYDLKKLFGNEPIYIPYYPPFPEYPNNTGPYWTGEPIIVNQY